MKVKQQWLRNRSFTSDWKNFKTLEWSYPGLDWDGAGEGLESWSVVDEKPTVQFKIGTWQWR